MTIIIIIADMSTQEGRMILHFDSLIQCWQLKKVKVRYKGKFRGNVNIGESRKKLFKYPKQI